MSAALNKSSRDSEMDSSSIGPLFLAGRDCCDAYCKFKMRLSAIDESEDQVYMFWFEEEISGLIHIFPSSRDLP
jgi:hypothetical protein